MKDALLVIGFAMVVAGLALAIALALIGAFKGYDP